MNNKHLKIISIIFIFLSLPLQFIKASNLFKEETIKYTCPDPKKINEDFFTYETNSFKTAWHSVPGFNFETTYRFKRIFLNRATDCFYSGQPSCYYVTCLYGNGEHGVTTYVSNYSEAIEAKSPLGANWERWNSTTVTCSNEISDVEACPFIFYKNKRI